MTETLIPVEVFCSYAPADEPWQQKLETHLSLLQKQGLISLWHNRLVAAGTDWAKTVDAHLETASIILLLMSADFFASDYCYGVEMHWALERAKQNEAYVIPLLLRPVEWRDAPFRDLPSLPSKNKSVTSWPNQDEAFREIAAGIRAAAMQICHAPDRHHLPPLRFQTIAVIPDQPEMTLEEAETTYRQQVVDAHGRTNVSGFASSDLFLRTVPLEKVFVRLSLVKESVRREGEREVIVHEPIALDQALNNHVLLVGEPGAGKSTLLRWLLVTFAQGLQRDPARIGPTADADRLPILIELGRLPNGYLTGDSRQIPDWQVLLPQEMSRQTGIRGIPPELFQHALDTGRCLLLFDGLDEIANRQARARLAQSLAQIPHRYPGNLVLVGSRPAGLTSESEGAFRLAFQHCQIQRFTLENLQGLFRFWYALDQALPPDARQRKADALVERIEAMPGTLNLAGTPLFATLLLFIWRKDGMLPERRTKLYERACQLLLEEWEHSHDVADRGIFAELGWEQLLRLLMPIAYAIHHQEQRTSINRDDLQALLREGLLAEKLCHSDTAGLEATRFVEVLALRSGLLEFQGDGQYRFPHLTIQEYLAARHLAALPTSASTKLVLERLHDSWWQEVHLLTIGQWGTNLQGATQAATLLRVILRRYRPPSYILRSSHHILLRFVTPGRWFPQIQLTRRLAWLLHREEIFAFWAAAECAPDILPPALLNDLAKHAAALVLTLLTDEARRPLLEAWLSAPGRQLPLVVNDAIARTLVLFLQKRGKGIWRAVIERFNNISIVHDIELALRDIDKEMCKVAIESLGHLSNVQEIVIPVLLSALHDEDEDVRDAAVDALGNVGRGHTEVVSALFTALSDPNTSVSLGAMASLSQITSEPDALKAWHDTMPDRELVRGKPSELWDQLVAESSGRVASGQEVATPRLIKALSNPNESVRWGAVDMLQYHINHPAVIPALATVLLSDSDASVREQAAMALDWSASSIIGKGLSNQNKEIATSALIRALSDPDKSVHGYAARSLGNNGDGRESVISGLLTALHDSDALIRRQAAGSLGQVARGQESVTSALLAALQDPDRLVRFPAARSLGQVAIGQEAAISALLIALRDHNTSMRISAAEGLGKMKVSDPAQFQQALIALNRCLHTWDGDERRTALEAINRLVAGRMLPDKYHKLLP